MKHPKASDPVARIFDELQERQHVLDVRRIEKTSVRRLTWAGPKYFSDEPNPPAWLEALAEVRRMGPRQDYRFLHVQAIIVAIDQYAEAVWHWRESTNR